MSWLTAHALINYSAFEFFPFLRLLLRLAILKIQFRIMFLLKLGNGSSTGHVSMSENVIKTLSSKL